MLIRPLLALGRDRCGALAAEAGLPFRDDPTNAEPLYARNRIRNEVLPVLREIGPEAEATIAETQAELAEEARGARPARGRGAGASPAPRRPARSAARRSRRLDPADPAPRPAPARRARRRAARCRSGATRAAEIWRLVDEPEGGVVELGGGVEAQVEHGHVRFTRRPARAEPAEATLTVPGRLPLRHLGGPRRARAERAGRPTAPTSRCSTRRALGGSLTVRAWRDGDRMRPLGLGGTKSLQDLFTDRKVPRSLRHALPVVTSEGRIAWIAGVAVSEEFAARPGARSPRC